MKDYRLVSINDEPSTADKEVMKEGMLAYHQSKGHIRNQEFFSTVIKDKMNKTCGIVVVSFLWNGMHIQTLWIDESIRNQGWGTKLMEIAEKEAVKRGCNLAYTDTYSWQAPEFYKKLGYTLYAKLEDFPKGCSLSYFKKILGNN